MQRQQTGGRLKAIIVLLISFIVAGGATFLVIGLLKRASLPRATSEVVVAIHDLPSAVPIKPEDVRLLKVSRDALPENARFLPLSDQAGASAASLDQAVPTFYTTIESVVGRTPRELILTREPVRAERLADPEKGIGLNAVIAKGKRAMSVEVNAETGVAGLLQPGHQVDVIVTIQPEEDNPEAEWLSFAFLQKVQVLAVDREFKKGSENMPLRQPKESASANILGNANAAKRDARDKPTVTLEVSLEEAELLALAASKGEIHLVLRNDQDDDKPELSPISSSVLLGLQDKTEKTPTTESKAQNYVYIDTKTGGNTVRSWYDAQGNKIREQVISKGK